MATNEQVTGTLRFTTQGTQVLQDADAKLDSITKTSRITAMATAWNAVTLALGQVKSVLSDVERHVMSLAEDETATQRLVNTFQRFGGTAVQLARAGDEIQRIRRESRIGDTQLTDTLDILIAKTGDVEGSMQALGLAVDVAAKTKKDLVSVTQAFGDALTGNAETMGTFIPELREWARANRELRFSEESKMHILETVRKQMGGAAAEDRNTYTGSIHGAKDAWAEFSEALARNLGIHEAYASIAEETAKNLNAQADAINSLTMKQQELRALEEEMGISSGPPRAGGRGGALGILLRNLPGIYAGRRIDRTQAEIDEIYAMTGGPRAQEPPAGAPFEYPPMPGGIARPDVPMGDPGWAGMIPSLAQWDIARDAGHQEGMLQLPAHLKDTWVENMDEIDLSVGGVAENMAAQFEWATMSVEERIEAMTQRVGVSARAIQGVVVGTQQATFQVVQALLLKENVSRLKGLAVVKYVAASGLSAVMDALAKKAGARAGEDVAEALSAMGRHDYVAAGHFLAAAAKWGALGGVASGIGAAAMSGAQSGLDRDLGRAESMGESISSGSGGSAGSSGTGGANPGVRIMASAAGAVTYNYYINTTYQGAVVYGDGGTNDWFWENLVPLINEARKVGAIA